MGDYGQSKRLSDGRRERIILIEPKTKSASLYQKGKKEATLYDYADEIAIIEGLTLKLKNLL